MVVEGEAAMTERSRFKVIDNTSGQEVKDAFVLLPEDSPAARIALAAYAEASRGRGVRGRLLAWLDSIHKKNSMPSKSDHVNASRVLRRGVPPTRV